MSITIDQLPETRRLILKAIKRDGTSSATELSAELELSSEGVRQHLMHLEREGWIERRSDRGSSHGGGRPTLRYSLTTDGEHLFPKHYDALTVEVLDTVAGSLGSEALKGVLEAMTQARIRDWEPRLQGLDLNERLQALRNIYMQDDGYMDIEDGPEGPALIEKNCPFMNVAKRRPVLCSVTITTLTRLLGVRVVREEKFQNGDGRCVFRIHPDQPIDPSSVGMILED